MFLGAKFKLTCFVWSSAPTMDSDAEILDEDTENKLVRVQQQPQRLQPLGLLPI